MRHSSYLNKKSLFLVILLLFAVSLSVDAKKKPRPELKYKVFVTSTNHSEKGKLISFYARTSEWDKYWIKDFHIENGTDERVYIEWENARLKDARIIFNDDRRITMNNPKADEAVSSHGKSIDRTITSEKCIGSNNIYTLLTYKAGDLKKELGKTYDIFFMIPIRFSDNTVEEYQLKFSIWYEVPESTE